MSNKIDKEIDKSKRLKNKSANQDGTEPNITEANKSISNLFQLTVLGKDNAK